MKKTRKMEKIFLICGKSCAGKDTLTKEIMKSLKIPMALSFTTRPKRNGETQGVEYDFIDINKFEWLQDLNKLAEYTSYTVAGGDIWYYGLTKKELEKDKFVLAIVNPDGVKQIKELYGEDAIVIVIEADDKKRIKRYLDRDSANNIEECFRRYKADEKDFRNLKPDYTINNNDFKIGFKHLEGIIRREMANTILKKTQEDFKNNPANFLGR